MKGRTRRIVFGIAGVVLLGLAVYAYTIFGPQGPPAPSEEVAYRDATWTVFRPEVFTVAVENNQLHLTLNRVARWAGNGQGGLVYQAVTGNFKVTAKVFARRASDPTQTVASWVSLGGLTARNPAGADQGATENYVHIVAGNTPSGIGVETKTTVNGATSFVAVPGPSGDAELRICRLNDTFQLYQRPIGAMSWTLAATHVRADLPGTLQVGANIYAVLPPNLRVSFEDLRIEEVADQAGCEQT